jgi:hypothetical protein
MSPNGAYTNSEQDETRAWGLLSGVGSIETAMPTLITSANALRHASQALGSIAGDIGRIRSDSARAISDMVAMRQTLANMTEREQQLRRELEGLRAEIRRAPPTLPKAAVEKVVRRRRKRGKRAA